MSPFFNALFLQKRMNLNFYKLCLCCEEMKQEEVYRWRAIALLAIFAFGVLSCSFLVSAVEMDDPFAYTLTDLKKGVSVSLEVGESLFWNTAEGRYDLKIVSSDGKQVNVSVLGRADIFNTSLRLGQTIARDITGDALPDYELTFESVQASLIVLHFRLLEIVEEEFDEEDSLTIERTAPPLSNSALLENGSRRIGAPIRGLRVADTQDYVEVPRSLFSMNTLYVYRLEIIVFLFISFGILVLIAVIAWILRNQREAIQTQSFFAPTPGRSW